MQHLFSHKARSTDDLKIHQKKAFNQLLASNTLKYSGTQKESYRKWSRDFKRETEELALSDIQQLELLKTKTSHAARVAIQPITGLETELATSQILSHAWSCLEKRFSEPHKP